MIELKKNSISTNQMITGDSKGVNYRHVLFDSIACLGMDTALLWLPQKENFENCVDKKILKHF